MRITNIFIYFILALLFVSCSTTQKDIKIYDLENVPQSPEVFTEKIDSDAFYAIQYQYDKYYFRAWNTESFEDIESIKWPFRSYKAKGSYGENLQPIKEDFFIKMYDNANFDAYLSVSKKAITLKNVNIRAFPTIMPLFKNPNLAGEGFPFDYLQNSTVSANKPIFVSHFSKDKEWIYIFTSFASGWVKSRDIVFVDGSYADLLQEAPHIFLTKDNQPLYTPDGKFLFNSRVGMMLPLVKEYEDHYVVLAVSKNSFFKPLYIEANIPKTLSHKGILKINKHNLNAIIKEMLKSHYGWGGLYNQRDCSSTMRDLFAPFGIWLPRNSSQQAKIGEVVSLNGLSNSEKIKLIKEKAIPFQTLLYKRGHILLYVGIYNSKIIVFHNTWGIKTKVDGTSKRVIVGRSVFSTLELGKNQKGYDENLSILKKLVSFNILTHVQY